MGNVVGGSGSTGTQRQTSHASQSPVNTPSGAFPHDELISRLTPADIQRYTDGFRRVTRAEASNTASSGKHNARQPLGITKKVFRSKVLGAFTMIPHSLSDRLFEVLDVEQNGELTLPDILHALAILKKGTSAERVQLLFDIYDIDRERQISRVHLEKFMEVIYGRRQARSPSTVAYLNQLFQGSPTLSLQRFSDIAGLRDEATGSKPLVDWLQKLAIAVGQEEDADIAALERSYNPVVIRNRIADKTKFSQNEVAIIERHFHQLFDAQGGGGDRVASNVMVAAMADNRFPRSFLQHFCDQLSSENEVESESGSRTRRNFILFDEFCQLLSDFCKGTWEERCKHLYELYQDSNGLSFDAMKQIVLVALSCDYEDNVKERLAEEAASIEKSFQAHAWDKKTFMEWAANSVTVQQILHQLAFATCVLFGIKPESPSVERRIVEWQWGQSTKSFSVGDRWNLVGAVWWKRWCHYVGMDPLNGTPRGFLPLPHLPHNANFLAAAMPSPHDPSSPMSQHQPQPSYASRRPGPISNWDLLKQSGSRRLRDKLVLARDFCVVPSSVYQVLHTWYTGGPELARWIVPSSNDMNQLELFPLILRLARVDTTTGGSMKTGEEVLLSQLSTPESLVRAACKALLLTKQLEKARLWYFDERSPHQKFRLPETHQSDLRQLTQDSVLLLELQDNDGSWPLSHTETRLLSDSKSTSRDQSGVYREQSISPSDKGRQAPARTSELCARGNGDSARLSDGSTSASSTSEASIIESERIAAVGTVKKRFQKDAFTGDGLVGLDNLGNTCYMSSALQCLSHTKPLVSYFRNEAYLNDINVHSKHGARGRLAVAFGELLRVLWTPGRKHVAPSEFKKVLSRFNTQFVGADQHDSQEFLASLLDGLSEDLNRIVKKPYTEQPDSDGRSDAVVADEWWRAHLAREMSVIVALFTGQYKSLLECSVCRYESARFEPFSFLQLSLPESHHRTITMTVIFHSGRVPLRYSVRVRNEDTVQELLDQVAPVLEKDGQFVDNCRDHAILAIVSPLHIVECLLNPNTPLTQVQERDQLTVFQLDLLSDVKKTVSELMNASAEEREERVDSEKDVEETYEIQSDTLEEDSGVSTQSTFAPLDLSNDDSQPQVDGADKKQVSTAPELLLPYGSSVSVRMDRSRELMPARVIGSNADSRMVDVAFHSGLRRYNIPKAKIVERTEDEALVYLVHRRVEKSMNAFTNIHITRCFGTPLVLRISLANTTTYELYWMVWKRLRRIFNWQKPPSPQELDDTTDVDLRPDKLRTHVADLALGRHLNITKFGFCLRRVTSHGVGCSRCEWLDGCLGCLVVPSVREKLNLAADETLAMDWDNRTLKEEYDPVQAAKMDEDKSVQEYRHQDSQPLNLRHCLDIFTAKEEIPEAFCGRCKTLRPASKTMELWRLPPVLVIQLKRFCYTQVSRRKLHHVVDFPLKGLRLEDFVAKSRGPRQMNECGVVYWQFLGGKLVEEEKSQDVDAEYARQEEEDLMAQISPNAHLDPNTIAASEANADDPSFAYDLYGVVNHVGALGGGHYFAYVLNEQDGQWKCFNDHQCKNIDAKEVVSSTAYILFYRRRDTQNVPIEHLYPPSNHMPRSLSGRENGKADVEELMEESRSAGGSSCTVS